MELDLRFIRERQELSQGLADYRNSYLAADDAAKHEAREFVETLARLAATQTTALGSPDILLVTITSAYKEGDLKRFVMSPRILASAITASDRGEFYTPEPVDVLNEPSY